MHSDSVSELPMFQLPRKIKVNNQKNLLNLKYIQNSTSYTFTSTVTNYLACRGITEPVIKPLSLLLIPKYTVNCISSCFSSFQEAVSYAILSSSFCQKGNVKFHLNQRIKQPMSTWTTSSKDNVNMLPASYLEYKCI